MDFMKGSCRLCRESQHVASIEGIDERAYYVCRNCGLIFTDARNFLGPERERSRYATHQNGIEFEGHVRFLMQAITPALEFLKKDMIGLDFGCGPVPTLSKLLMKAGYRCEDHDPFFVPHALNKKFDFIFATEVFEHFFYPEEEIDRLRSLLHEKGLLIVMTERWKDESTFSQWYYAKDKTHVCFYSDRTFVHICEHFGFEKVFDDGQRVIILRRVAKGLSFSRG